MAICTVVTLLLLLTITASSGSLTPQVNYVQPFSDLVSCTSNPCTFDQYAHYPDEYFHSNTTFMFLPGGHLLNNSLYLHSIQNVSFQGMLMEGSVTISLGPQVGLNFANCDSIEIKSLNFLLSGNFEYRLMFSDSNNIKLHNILISTEEENNTGYGAIISQASAINISDSSFVGLVGRNGAALLALNSSGILFTGSNNFSNNTAKLGGAIHSIDSTLEFTEIASFINNAAISDESDTLYFSYTSIDYIGLGGAIFAENTRVIINGCAQFLDNNAAYRGGAIAAVNSSTLLFNGSQCFSEIYPTTVLFNGNHVTSTGVSEDTDKSGSGGAIFTYNCIVNITNISLFNNLSPGNGGAAQFYQSDVTLSNIIAVNNSADNFFGGAIHLISCKQVLIGGDNDFINNSAMAYGGAINVYQTQFLKIGGKNSFKGNTAYGGGALGIYKLPGMINFICGDSIMFKGNSAYSGGAVYVYNATIHFCGNNMFAESVADYQGGALYIEASTVLFNGTNMTLFYDNAATYGGSVASLDSRINLYGKIQFHNNSATAGNGGAMALYGISKVVLNPLTVVDFLENHAQFDGGAIYFEDLNCYVANDAKPECFIILNTTYSLLNNSSILLNFTNNMAAKNGPVLYGGQLGRCKLLFNSNKAIDTCGDTIEVQDNAYEIIVMNISTISFVGANEQQSHVIASPPEKLCLCNNISYECASDFRSLLKYEEVVPGQAFEIAMVAQDLYGYNIQGIQIAILSDAGKRYTLTQENNTITSLSCRNFTYRLSVESTNAYPIFTFYIPVLCRSRSNNISLGIKIKLCPVGFTFSIKKRTCVCANIVTKFTQECNVDNQSVNRSRNNFWIKITDRYFLIYERSCPLDYCKVQIVSITPSEPDVQCLEGRTGKICGSCKQYEGYSLVLGSLQCQKRCYNSSVSLLLIIPFGVLGILLIALLFLLRLTVSAGTINGMIFYANIVQANHQIFLPKITSKFNVFVVFISWLNLDFGIQACFFEKMDIYSYSWLQFLFPLYLWILMVIIIVSAHYSRRVAKRLGHNPVAVLATVLLISYGKMLKAIIVPLSPAILKKVTQSESNISKEIVWLYNGDISYGEPKHIILVVVAILVLVILFLPYTLLLLCGRYFQMKSQWRILSWINKLKPFMDAYHAPFRKGKCYWSGLFLLVRCGLFLNVAFTPDYAINLTVVSSIVAGLAIIKGQVYEKWYNDFLETFFLLNLCILSIGTLYVQSEDFSDPQEVARLQNILSSVSVGIAFLCFIGIILFHVYRRIRELKLFQKINMRKSYSLNKKSDENAYKEQNLEITISNSSISLRELLLDDDS